MGPATTRQHSVLYHAILSKEIPKPTLQPRYVIHTPNIHIYFSLHFTFLSLLMSLDAVSSLLGINKIIERKTHGALIDAEVCARVYQHFLTQL